MKSFNIEWSGIFTRDIGWDEVEAETFEAAREAYLREHGQYRRIRGIIEINNIPQR
jgi:hypothetical protein